MLVLLRWPMPAGGVQEGKALGARWDGQGEAEGRRCGEHVGVVRSRGGDGVRGEAPACSRPRLNRHNALEHKPAAARRGRPAGRPGRLLGGRRAAGSGPGVVGRGGSGGGPWRRATTGGYWVARAGRPLSTSKQGVGHGVRGVPRCPPMMVERKDGAASNR